MRRRGKAVAKADLPQKPCAACNRPFSWRRKWARDWETVRFCSDRCRAAAKAVGSPRPAGDDRAEGSLTPRGR